MNVLSSGIYLTPEHWNFMVADVMAKSPEEACGFVAGMGNQSRLIIPITNILHDTTRFRMDPEEELKAFTSVEDRGLEILAVYHSHPHGIDRPSPTDEDQLTFPGIVYLICIKMTVNGPAVDIIWMLVLMDLRYQSLSNQISNYRRYSGFYQSSLVMKEN